MHSIKFFVINTTSYVWITSLHVLRPNINPLDLNVLEWSCMLSSKQNWEKQSNKKKFMLHFRENIRENISGILMRKTYEKIGNFGVQWNLCY